jgi:hypothetical protein
MNDNCVYQFLFCDKSCVGSQRKLPPLKASEGKEYHNLREETKQKGNYALFSAFL